MDSSKKKRGLQRANLIAERWDFWTDEASRQIEAVQRQIKEIKKQQQQQNCDNLTSATCRDSERFHAWNPRHLVPVQRIMMPEKSLLRRVYVTDRPFVTVPDQVQHCVRKVDDIYRKRPGPLLPLRTRDQDGLRILGGLEIYKDMLQSPSHGYGEGKWRDDRRENLLFSRNWPMTEKNKARSLQEFIKR